MQRYTAKGLGNGLTKASASGLAALLLIGCSGDDEGPPPPAPNRPFSVYDSERLLQVDIEISEADWDGLRYDGRSLEDMVGPQAMPYDYTEYTARVRIDGDEYSNVEIRKKGFIGSLSVIRPSIKLDFGDEISIDDEGNQRLTLNNDQQDPSHVRQCVAFRLFEQIGVPSPRCSFAQVRVNGVDLGVYTNVEPVRKRFLRRYFEEDEGNLYEGTLADFTQDTVDQIEWKDRDGEPSRRDLGLVMEALAAPDEEVVAALEQQIDLPRFIDFWALETLLGHWDGYSGNSNNYYLYRDPTTERFSFIPWGLDQVFVGRPDFNQDPYEITGYAHGAISRRLYDLPEQRAAFRGRLLALLDEIWNEQEMLSQVAALVDVAFDADPTAVDAARSYITDHPRVLRDAVGPELPDVPLREAPFQDECTYTTGRIETSFDTVWATDASNFSPTTTSLRVDGAELDADFSNFTVGDPGAGTALLLQTAQVGAQSVTLGVIMPLELLTPGVHPFHSFETFGFINVLPEGAMQGEEIGFGVFGDGEITLESGSATPGSPLVGSFSANIYQSRCANLQ